MKPRVMFVELADGRKFMPRPQAIDDRDGCGGCAAKDEHGTNHTLCNALPPCEGLVWVDDTPENRAEFVERKLKENTS